MKNSADSFIAFILLSLLACSAFGQIVPAMINPVGTPLQLVSINSNFTDFLNVVTVKNISDRQIASFQLGIIMSVPNGCGPKQIFGSERLMQPDRVVIARNATAETRKYGLAPGDIQMFGAANEARVVHTQLAVVRVDFSDGGSWFYPRAGKIYDESLMTRDAQLQCSNTVKARLTQASVATH
jgi:hypothetical protein